MESKKICMPHSCHQNFNHLPFSRQKFLRPPQKSSASSPPAPSYGIENECSLKRVTACGCLSR